MILRRSEVEFSLAATELEQSFCWFFVDLFENAADVGQISTRLPEAFLLSWRTITFHFFKAGSSHSKAITWRGYELYERSSERRKGLGDVFQNIYPTGRIVILVWLMAQQ